jgi:hypothetical protein
MNEVAEKVETTRTLEIVEDVSAADSNGDSLTVGDIVRISTETVYGKFDDETGAYTEKRDLDWGQVVSINADGTVNVQWDGCGCSLDASSRVEDASDLTVSSDNEQAVYYIGRDNGYREGYDDARERMREMLGWKQ